MSNSNTPETKCAICGLRVSKWLASDHKHITALEQHNEAALERGREIYKSLTKIKLIDTVLPTERFVESQMHPGKWWFDTKEHKWVNQLPETETLPTNEDSKK